MACRAGGNGEESSGGWCGGGGSGYMVVDNLRCLLHVHCVYLQY